VAEAPARSHQLPLRVGIAAALYLIRDFR
jgi:hypothetical protein